MVKGSSSRSRRSPRRSTTKPALPAITGEPVPVQPPPSYKPPDGVALRTLLQERRLNDAFAVCFEGESGVLALEYLRQQSYRTVTMPVDDNGNATPEGKLWFREGMRMMVAMIERRVADGRRKMPKLPGEVQVKE